MIDMTDNDNWIAQEVKAKIYYLKHEGIFGYGEFAASVEKSYLCKGYVTVSQLNALRSMCGKVMESKKKVKERISSSTIRIHSSTDIEDCDMDGFSDYFSVPFGD